MLRLERVSRRSRDGHTVLDGLSIDVHAGEIVGIAGVEGNGQTAIGDVLSSLTRIDGGRVFVDGREVPTGRAGAMAAAGIGVIPEDRHDSGCVLGMSVAENLVLDDPHSIAVRGFVSRRRLDERARQLMREFEIQAPSPWAPMWSLSGGNQQRVVLARSFRSGPRCSSPRSRHAASTSVRSSTWASGCGPPPTRASPCCSSRANSRRYSTCPIASR